MVYVYGHVVYLCVLCIHTYRINLDRMFKLSVIDECNLNWCVGYYQCELLHEHTLIQSNCVVVCECSHLVDLVSPESLQMFLEGNEA